MKLSSYLNEKFILENVEGKNMEETIHNIVYEIGGLDKNINSRVSCIEKGLIKRENEISTAIGKGIAIPHARVEDYDDVTVVIAKLANPIDIQVEASHSTDRVDLIFMIIAGKTKNRRILKLMASISKLVQNKDFLKKIREEKDINDVIKLIEKYELDIKDTITAEDIMCSELVPAKLTDTLEEIATRLILENRAGLPVVDEEANFIGEITERELIEYGMPRYTSIMNDLSFMTVGEPFEEYFKNENKVTVKELYRSTAEIIDRKSSIMEISFKMVSNKNTRLYVVENGMYFGTIFRSDIIKKVLHI
ncbi:MAG: PTS sugar transporter subunit IIA [Fusobacteriaceae bacterium]|nr:PTS sugar transporter subunit IIA [Fusobacteriaceae bacterium]MBN2837366.1 PTS sugar transporter subunit IIA [Fusobacteriaceae bacterium]